MTEQEWLESTNPQMMLDFVRSKASDRKLRLFACAACRRIWNLLFEERSRRAVDIAERYADGLVDEASLMEFRHEGRIAPCWATVRTAAAAAGSSIEGIIREVRIAAWSPLLDEEAYDFEHAALVASSAELAERSAQADLLREIFGTLARDTDTHPSWLQWNDGTVMKIAQRIYDESDFNLMPILADALEDAGCDNEDILRHCREPAEHVRGCWVVDLLLGKS